VGSGGAQRPARTLTHGDQMPLSTVKSLAVTLAGLGPLAPEGTMRTLSPTATSRARVKIQLDSDGAQVGGGKAGCRVLCTACGGQCVKGCPSQPYAWWREKSIGFGKRPSWSGSPPSSPLSQSALQTGMKW
jgi:ferredoxin